MSVMGPGRRWGAEPVFYPVGVTLLSYLGFTCLSFLTDLKQPLCPRSDVRLNDEARREVPGTLQVLRKCWQLAL